MAKPKIDSHVIYQEMYNEMRRFRDYELTASAWYTTILTAILGYLNSSGSQGILAELWVRSLLSFIIFIIGLAGIYSVEYAHRRFEEMKQFTKNAYIHDQPKLKNYAWGPYNVIEVSLLLLAVFNIGVLVNALVAFLLLIVVLVFKDSIWDVLFRIKEETK